MPVVCATKCNAYTYNSMYAHVPKKRHIYIPDQHCLYGKSMCVYAYTKIAPILRVEACLVRFIFLFFCFRLNFASFFVPVICGVIFDYAKWREKKWWMPYSGKRLCEKFINNNHQH